MEMTSSNQSMVISFCLSFLVHSLSFLNTIFTVASVYPSAKMTESSNQPLFGLWQPRPLQALYYGPDCVQKHLISCLPSESSKAFILTGSSLANKTSLVKDVEKLLGARHASTFSDIKQHAPVAELDRATELVLKDDKIDTIISIGGGSPIDSGKAISYRAHEKGGKWLHHITIPTTLSVAECKNTTLFCTTC